MLNGVTGFIQPRLQNLAYAGQYTIMLVQDSLTAAVATLADCILLGTEAPLDNEELSQEKGHKLAKGSGKLSNEYSRGSWAKESQTLVGVSLSRMFLHALRIINPEASYTRYQQFDKDGYLGKGRIRLGKTPPSLVNACVYQQNILNTGHKSGSRFSVRTRLFGAVSGVALAIAGIAFTVLGLIAALFAAFSLGKSHEYNSTAYNNLPGIAFAVNQLHQGFIGLFRPSHLITPPQPKPQAQSTNKTLQQPATPKVADTISTTQSTKVPSGTKKQYQLLKELETNMNEYIKLCGKDTGAKGGRRAYENQEYPIPVDIHKLTCRFRKRLAPFKLEEAPQDTL